MQLASMEDRCAPKGPDRNSSSRTRPIESNRMWLWGSFIRWSGTRTCRPNLTSIPPRWAGVDGSRQHGSRPVPACADCEGFPEPRAGAGAGPHDRTCARPHGGLVAHSMRRTRDAADPEHHSWRYPATVSFPQQRPAIDPRSTAGRQSSLGFDCLRETPKLSRSV
jgi:hypothetical protein